MKVIVISLIMICIFGFKLSNAQEVVAASGDYFKRPNGSMSITIGEPITETFLGSTIILTQGFQQNSGSPIGIDELSGSQYKITAYPNPTGDFIIVKVEDFTNENFCYELYDNTGKFFQNGQMESGETKISFNKLMPSTYFIKIFIDKTEVTSFKIIKQ